VFTRDRRAVIRWYALSCAIAEPAVVLVFVSPGYADTSWGSRILNFWITLGPRSIIVLLPMLFVALRQAGMRWALPVALFLVIGFNVGFYAPLNVYPQLRDLVHRASHTKTLDAYTSSAAFERGATYRVLRADDGKLGLYHVVRAGGRLDSELFPESMAIRNFRDVAAYADLLCERHVDQILHFDTYDRARRTNERTMIEQLASRRGAVALRVLARGSDWQAYAVDRSGCDRRAVG
jgi:hypothetical protein